MTILSFKLPVKHTANFTKLFTLGDIADFDKGIIDIDHISPDKQGLYEAIIVTPGNSRGLIIGESLKPNSKLKISAKRADKITSANIRKYYFELQSHLPELTYEDFLFLVSNSSANNLISIPQCEMKALLDNLTYISELSRVTFDETNTTNTLKLTISDKPKKRELSSTCNASLQLGQTGQTIYMQGDYSTNDPQNISYQLIDDTPLGKYLLADEKSTLRALLLNDPILICLYYTSLSGNEEAYKKFTESAKTAFFNTAQLLIWELNVFLAFMCEKKLYSSNAIELLKQALQLPQSEKKHTLLIIKQCISKLLKLGTEENILFLLDREDLQEEIKSHYSDRANLANFFAKNLSVSPIEFFAKYRDIFNMAALFDAVFATLQEQIVPDLKISTIVETFVYKAAIMFLQNPQLCAEHLSQNMDNRCIIKVILAIEQNRNLKNRNRSGFFAGNLLDAYLNCPQLFPKKTGEEFNAREEFNAMVKQFNTL